MTQPAPVEDRSNWLGASEAGAVLGVDPFTTRLQLYERKVGLEPPYEGNRHTRRGTRLEEVAAEEYTEATGRTLHRVNTRFTHPVYPYITCRIDRRIVGDRRLVEIKVPSLGSYAKMRREGIHEGYVAQLHVETGLSQMEAADWWVWNADQWEGFAVPVDFDAKLYTEVIDRMVDFWTNYVLKRVPPPAEFADQERLEIRRIEGEAKLYAVTDPEQVEAFVNLRDAKKLKADAEALEEDARAHVDEILGENFGIYTAGGVRATYSQAKGRSSFDRKALEGAKPLDRIKVGELLTPYFKLGTVPEDVIKAIGEANLDLTQFDKPGKPYGTLRLSEAKP